MVPSQEEEVLGILDLIGEEKADGFEGLFAAVNVIAEEEVVGLGWITAVFE